MSTPARPIAAAITVDRLTSTNDITEFAQLDSQIDGTQPYVRFFRLDTPCAPVSLLPAGASIERCVTTDTSVSVVARVEGATIHIGALTRSTTVRVSAESHDRAGGLAATMRSKANPVPAGSVSVRVWHHSCDQRAKYDDRHLDAPVWSEIDGNYPARTRAALDAVLQLQRPSAAGKLLLWHGPPGTGKTTAVRALLRGWAPWCQGQYIADPEKFFGEPGYMTEVLTTAPVVRTGPTLIRAGQPNLCGAWSSQKIAMNSCAPAPAMTPVPLLADC